MKVLDYNRLIKIFLIVLIVMGSYGCATFEGKVDNTKLEPPYPPSVSSYPTPPTPSESPGTSASSQSLTLPSASLWNSQVGSLYRDIKAKTVGDIVTITVSESSDASGEATTEVNRSHNWGGKLSASNPAVAGKNLLGGSTSMDYGAEFGRGLKGSGKTTRTNTVKAYMTATVVEVLPNGNLVIRGSRWVKVNDELHQIVLEGVIRPTDITRNNTVMSQNIADAKIFIVGKGPVSRQQRPGWLGQIIDLLFPF
ncbi:MAG: flagellar basal body L-ring protein FlgH [Syntrophobacterales bacterium]|nr:flagellar basal body L-ring protein FlgH [Syntrophobacterales bacterium]